MLTEDHRSTPLEAHLPALSIAEKAVLTTLFEYPHVEGCSLQALIDEFGLSYQALQDLLKKGFVETVSTHDLVQHILSQHHKREYSQDDHLAHQLFQWLLNQPPGVRYRLTRGAISLIPKLPK